MRPILRQIKPRHVMLLVVLLAYPLLKLVIQPRIPIIGDASYYVTLSHEILENGILNFSGIDAKPYGYPLFLAIIQWGVAPINVNIVEFVTLVQFLFHLGIAFLATSIFIRINDRVVPSFVRAACFVLVFTAPPLLGLTRNFLAETLSGFCITLFFWCFTSSSKWRFLWMSIIWSCSVVLRLIHLHWGIGYLGSMTLLYLVYTMISATRRKNFLASLRQVPIKDWINYTIQILLPIIIIIGLQFYLVAKTKGTFEIIGRQGSLTERTLIIGTYYYKYEALDLIEHSDAIHYLSESRYALAQTLQTNGQNVNLITMFIADVFSSVNHIIVKTVGLFQNYEWRIYRQVDIKQINFIFLWGLIPLALFVHSIGVVGSGIIRGLTVQPSEPVNRSKFFVLQVTMLYGAVTYIGIYAILWAETRYIAPVLPIVLVTGFTLVWSKDRYRWFLLAFIVAFMLYMLTYFELTPIRLPELLILDGTNQ